MRAGRLRHRVELQMNLPTTDAHGGKVDSWASMGHAWAEVRELSGREFLTAQEAHAEVTTKVFIRWRRSLGDLEPLLWRVLYPRPGGRLSVYDVLHVLDLDGRRRDLELLCRAVT